MTNPQDIDKAFDAEFPHAGFMSDVPSDFKRKFYRAGWAAALRAVQEPVAWRITWLDEWKSACVATRPIDRGETADTVRKAWDACNPDHGPHAVEALVRATPLPPGAASPAGPAPPPYKYSWPGERAPDALLIKDNAVAVDPDYFYRPMATCPRGVKCVLLNEGGVATIAVYAGEPHWRGWAPLPKERRG